MCTPTLARAKRVTRHIGSLRRCQRRYCTTSLTNVKVTNHQTIATQTAKRPRWLFTATSAANNKPDTTNAPRSVCDSRLVPGNGVAAHLYTFEWRFQSDQAAKTIKRRDRTSGGYRPNPTKHLPIVLQLRATTQDEGTREPHWRPFFDFG